MVNLLTIYLEIAGILVFEVKKSFAVEETHKFKNSGICEARRSLELISFVSKFILWDYLFSVSQVTVF